MGKFTLRLGRSIGFCQESFYELLQETKDLGYDTFDFDIAGAWPNEEKENAHYAHLEWGMEYVKKVGLPVNGIHVSFGGRWDYSDTNEENRRKVVENTKKIFARTATLNPYCYILHGSFEPIDDKDRAAKLAALVQSVKELASSTPAYICLEVLPRTCLLNTAKETLEVMEKVNIDNVRVCVDVNHFLQEKSEDGLRALGKWVKTLHISDHDYENERHWLPGEGKIDWMKLIGVLEEIGYEGVFNYECSRYTPVQMKENFERLFARYNAEKE